ncbi:MAG: hypothetical protein EAZ17_03805, partial [Sphingobacteriales bacterium]
MGMKKHILWVVACATFFYLACTKESANPDTPKPTFPEQTKALLGKWYLRQTLYEEYRYDGLGKVQNFGYTVGSLVFLEFTNELWNAVPGTQKVTDQTIGLARPNYGSGIILTERWEFFHADSIQIGPNRVRV